MTIPLDIRRRILVRAPNWVGDAVMASAALRKLRMSTPGSRIVVMCRPWVAPVFRGSPDVDELWEMEDAGPIKFWKAVRRIRRGAFDMGVSFPNSFRAAALMALGGVGRRIGYARGARRLLLNKSIPVTPKLLENHLVHYYFNLVEWMGDGQPDPPRQVLRPTEAARAFVDEKIHQAGWDDGALRVGIAPGSIGALSKRWSAERFARVAEIIHRQLGARIFLIGSRKETDALAKVREASEVPVHDLGADMNLDQVIAFMDRLDAFIGNDSGAAHMAAALGLPSVVIFGPTDWRATSPFSSASKVVRRPVECSPCNKRVCPIQGHPCMSNLKVDDVTQAFAELAPLIQARQTARHGVGV